MNTAHVGKKWAAALLLSVAAATVQAQQFDFQIDQPSSGGTAQFHVAATTSGTLIGNYDSATNPGGTRTKPGFSSPAAGENVAVPVSKFNPDAIGDVTFSPSGTFSLDFDIAAGSVTITDLNADLLGGNTATIPVSAAVSFSTFSTANPSGLVPGIPLTVPLGDAILSTLTATQVPGGSVGTLTPLGSNQYSFSLSPMVILQANVEVQGSPLDVPSDPLPFPLAGTVTLSGNTATINENAPVDVTDNQTPATPIPPIPYDVTPLGGSSPAHLLFNLTLNTTTTTVTGNQTIVAQGTAVAPPFSEWTGASLQSSNWSDASNWSGGVPNGVDAVAHFSNPAVPRTVNVDSPVTVGAVEFSANQGYVIQNGQLTFSSAATASLAVTSGSHSITSPLLVQSNLDVDVATGASLYLANSLTIDPGVTVTRSGGTGQLRLGPVTMQGGSTLNLTAGQTTIAQLSGGSLQVAAGASAILELAPIPHMLDGLDLQGTLDLGESALVLNYTGASPYADFAALISQGNLFSSATLSDGIPAEVALVDNNLIHLTSLYGAAIASGGNFDQLLFLTTYPGDTNLDGQVTDADFVNVVANMGRTGVSWFEGDLNGDGIVSAADYNIVGQYLGAGQPLALARSTTPVPEPAALSLLALAALTLPRRRKTS